MIYMRIPHNAVKRFFREKIVTGGWGTYIRHCGVLPFLTNFKMKSFLV